MGNQNSLNDTNVLPIDYTKTLMKLRESLLFCHYNTAAGMPKLFSGRAENASQKMKEPSFKLESQGYTIQLALMSFLFKNFMNGTKQ